MTDAANDTTAEACDARPVREGSGPVRLLIGLAQGLLLWGLSEAADAKAWPATEPMVFNSLFLILLFTPLILLAGWGRMGLRTLATWAVAAAAVLAGLAVHDVASGVRAWEGQPRVFPTPQLIACAALGLFVAHSLVAAADHDRRPVGTYPTHFDLAWKHAVQLAVAVAFVGVFWAVLWLGAALFGVIGIDAFRRLLEQSWFHIPATTIAFAAAGHLTDVRVGLIRGVRTVALTLLSWLTPVMAVIAWAFLVALPFTGLEPLWETKAATAILLSAAAVLVVLTSTVYQEGEEGQERPAALRWTARAAGLALVPIVALAAYALSLRIGQYGLTPARVIAGACVAVGAILAVGYAVAAVKPGPFMRPLEKTNLVAAYAIIAALLALFSPVADPSRLSVDDQMARLKDGRTKPDRFDYQFLRFDSGPYGVEALERLTRHANSVVREKATAAMAAQGRYRPPEPQRSRLRPADVITPQGVAIPPAFFAQDWGTDETITTCTRQATNPEGTRCRAFTADVTGDAAAEIVVLHRFMGGAVFGLQDGRWVRVGSIQGKCEWEEAVDAGRITVVQPEFRDLELGDVTLRVEPSGERCPRRAPVIGSR